MKGEFRKIDDKTLVASDAKALDALAAIGRGQPCIGDVRGARNVKQFRLFWTLVGILAEQRDATKEATKEWLMEQIHYVEPLFYPDGRMKLKAKSIAFESMAQAEFAEMFRAAVPKIAEELGNAPEEILDRMNELLDPEGRDHLRKIMRHVSPPLVPSHANEREIERA